MRLLAYVFLPKGFDLLIGFNPDPEQVANIIGLNDYLSFVLRMFLVFGIAFVLPVFLFGLNLAGIVTGRQLLRAWRQVILGAFLFAAIATPSGDPWTMTALAVPMLLLYYIADHPVPARRPSPPARRASTASTTPRWTTTRPARSTPRPRRSDLDADPDHATRTAATTADRPTSLRP